MHSDQFKPKSYLKLIKKYIVSEGEQFPLSSSYTSITGIAYSGIQALEHKTDPHTYVKDIMWSVIDVQVYFYYSTLAVPFKFNNSSYT